MNELMPIVEVWDTGRVKWFDPARRYGFIIPDDEGEDVFFRWLLCQEYGIKESLLRPGVQVQFKWRLPDGVGRRPQAIAIKLSRR
jgi:cold shock CspA family protein